MSTLSNGHAPPSPPSPSFDSPPSEMSASDSSSSARSSLFGFFSSGDSSAKDESERRATAKSKVPQTPGDVSPFLAARREAGDRLFAAHRRARQWMVMALVLAVALTASVLGLSYLSLTSRVETEIIVYDGEGRLLHAGALAGAAEVPQAAVREHLRSVLEGLRTVYTDRRATSKSYLDAYDFILQGSEADGFLRDYFERTGENPVEQVGSLQRVIVEMEIGKIAGTRSWNLRWVERASRGGRITQSVWQGSFSVKRLTPSTDGTDRNPAAVYVDGISWRETSSQILAAEDAPPPSSD